MTAPSAPRTCNHCNTPTVTKQVLTTVPGAVPVALSLCRCDYGTCKACHADLPWTAKRCPSCDTSC